MTLTSACGQTQEYLAPGGPRLYGLEKFWALLHYAHNVPPYCDIEVHPTVRAQRQHARPVLVHM